MLGSTYLAAILLGYGGFNKFNDELALPLSIYLWLIQDHNA
jgi:hypothetical protein